MIEDDFWYVHNLHPAQINPKNVKRQYYWNIASSFAAN